MPTADRPGPTIAEAEQCSRKVSVLNRAHGDPELSQHPRESVDPEGLEAISLVARLNFVAGKRLREFRAR